MVCCFTQKSFNAKDAKVAKDFSSEE